MKILGFNIHISKSRSAESSSELQQRSVAEVGVDGWLRGQDLDAGSCKLSNAYEQVVWVYRAINVLAEQVANVPFLFSAGERGRENLITSGPLLDFYSRPHPQLNRFLYWELRVMWLMLRGECMRVPIYEDARGGTGQRRLKSVLLLDPARFQHIVEDHRLIGWRYTGFDSRTPLASQVFLPEEVWFEKLPNPFDFWRGFPPLHVAGLPAQTDYSASLFMRGLIENNGDSGLIVRTDKWLSEEQREQIRTALRDRKRRAGVADRPVLLLGTMEILKPQLSSGDLQFLENRKFSRAEICAAFGVPEEIVTSTDHAKYDVMAGARLNFIENRVAPLCSRLEAEEESTVRAIDPRASGWFDLDSLPILQEARRSRLAAARTGFDLGIPLNELNRVLDLGFKPMPWGNQGWVPGTMQKAGEVQEQTVPVKFLPKPAEAVAPALPDVFTRAERLVIALGKSTETKLDRKLKRFLFEQRGRVLAQLAKEPAVDSFPATQELLARIFDAPSEKQELAQLDPNADFDALHERVLAMLRHHLGGAPVSEWPAKIKAAYNQLSNAREVVECGRGVSGATAFDANPSPSEHVSKHP